MYEGAWNITWQDKKGRTFNMAFGLKWSAKMMGQAMMGRDGI